MNDRGETLVESVVSLVIISVSGLALLTGAAFTINNSLTHRTQSEATAEVRNWAERISGAGSVALPACAVAADFEALKPIGTGITTPPVTVTYWSGTGWTSTCATSYGIQKVKLKVTAKKGSLPAMSSEVEVVHVTK